MSITLSLQYFFCRTLFLSCSLSKVAHYLTVFVEWKGRKLLRRNCHHSHLAEMPGFRACEGPAHCTANVMLHWQQLLLKAGKPPTRGSCIHQSQRLPGKDSFRQPFGAVPHGSMSWALHHLSPLASGRGYFEVNEGDRREPPYARKPLSARREYHENRGLEIHSFKTIHNW